MTRAPVPGQPLSFQIAQKKKTITPTLEKSRNPLPIVQKREESENDPLEGERPARPNQTKQKKKKTRFATQIFTFGN